VAWHVEVRSGGDVLLPQGFAVTNDAAIGGLELLDALAELNP
jgi:hypothetical protein